PILRSRPLMIRNGRSSSRTLPFPAAPMEWVSQAQRESLYPVVEHVMRLVRGFAVLQQRLCLFGNHGRIEMAGWTSTHRPVRALAFPEPQRVPVGVGVVEMHGHVGFP